MRDGCAIVTGAARGIGAATATRAGRRRLAGGRQLPRRRRGRRGASSTEIEAAGGRAVAVAADVTDPEQRRRAVRPRSSESSARCSCW